MTPPLLFIEGAPAALGPAEPELAETYWEWEQDPAVLVGIGRQTLPSRPERDTVTRRHAESTLEDLRFTVYDITGAPRPAGTAGVSVDHRRRVGAFYLQIGTEAARGRGLGTEAARLTLDFAFHVTHLECVHLGVYAPNMRARRAYEKAGFRVCGTRRRAGLWLGERVDEVLMDAVPEDFPGPSAVRQRVDPGSPR